MVSLCTPWSRTRCVGHFASRTPSERRRCDAGLPTTCTNEPWQGNSRCRPTCSISSSTPMCDGVSRLTSGAGIESTRSATETSITSVACCMPSGWTTGGMSRRCSSASILSSSVSLAMVRAVSGATYVAVSPGNAPEAAEHDVLLGPWLHYVRDTLRSNSAVLWREAVDLTGEMGQVTALLGAAGIFATGVVNPRFGLLPIAPTLPASRAFSEALGAEHIPALDVDAYGMQLECHVVDFGVGGLLAFQRDWIYRESGAVPPNDAVGAGPRSADPDAARPERSRSRTRVARCIAVGTPRQSANDGHRLFGRVRYPSRRSARHLDHRSRIPRRSRVARGDCSSVPPEPVRLLSTSAVGDKPGRRRIDRTRVSIRLSRGPGHARTENGTTSGLIPLGGGESSCCETDPVRRGAEAPCRILLASGVTHHRKRVTDEASHSSSRCIDRLGARSRLGRVVAVIGLVLAGVVFVGDSTVVAAGFTAPPERLYMLPENPLAPIPAEIVALTMPVTC